MRLIGGRIIIEGDCPDLVSRNAYGDCEIKNCASLDLVGVTDNCEGVGTDCRCHRGVLEACYCEGNDSSSGRDLANGPRDHGSSSCARRRGQVENEG